MHVLHAGVSMCVPTPYPLPHAACVARPPCRVRRTVENKLFAGDERLEDVETELRAAKQAAQEWEARYEEVCLPPPPPPSLSVQAQDTSVQFSSLTDWVVRGT